MPENLQEKMDQGTSNQERSPHSGQYPLNAQVFETHAFIYIRIPIEEEDWLKKMKIFHTSNQSMIHGVPNNDDQHVISLPTLVRKKGTTVQYKDNVLEIRLQKQTKSLIQKSIFQNYKRPLNQTIRGPFYLNL